MCALARLLVRSTLARLVHDRQASVAVTFGLSATLLFGFAGLAIDVGFWQTAKHKMQWAADQASFSAAIAVKGGAGSADAIKTAQGVAAQMGYVGNATNCTRNTSNNITVCVNNPPTSGNYTTNHNAFEVIISQPQPMWFAGLFLSSAPTASARAVAVAGVSGNYCILLLQPTGTDISLQGSPALNTPNCNIQVDSTSSSAVNIVGSASITASVLSTSGNVSLQGAAHINATVKTAVTTVRDPYSLVTIPASSTWLGTGQSSCQTVTFPGNNSTVTLNPGCYTGTISVPSQGTLKLNAGTYYIDQGSISSNGGTITGTNVTIVLTSSTGSNYSTISLGGNSSVTLTPPSSGTFSGIVVYGDRNAPSSTSMSLGGGSNQSYTGALYFPSTSLSFGGDATTVACTQIIAQTISFSGNSSFNSSCSGVGTKPITAGNGVVE